MRLWKDREASEEAAREAPVAEQRSHLGRTITVRGTLEGSEGLEIDGRLEGSVRLDGHPLWVGPNAELQADVEAGEITIRGSVTGDVVASGAVHLHGSARLAGDVEARSLFTQEGAELVGKVSVGPR